MPNVAQRISLLAVTVLAAIALATFPSSPAPAAQFADGNFETQPASPPWMELSIQAGSLSHGTISTDPPGVGSYYAELGNSGSAAGGIYQTFDTVWGQNYALSFWGSGSEGQEFHTGYVAVGSGTWNGAVAVNGGAVNTSTIPQDELGLQPIYVDRSALNLATSAVDGWNYFSGYNFTGTSGTSTITFWNDNGNAVRVDNIVLTALPTELLTSKGSGSWNNPAVWAGSGPALGYPQLTTNTLVQGGNLITIGAAGSPAAANILKISGGTIQLIGGTLAVGNAQIGALNTQNGALVMDGASVLTIPNADTAVALAGLRAASGATVNVSNQLLVNANIDLSNVNLNIDSNGLLTLASGVLTKTDGLSVATVQATGGSVNIAGTGLTVTSSLTVDGAPFYAAGAGPLDLSTADVVVQNGGKLVMPADLTANSLTLQSSGVLLKPGSAGVSVNSLALYGANLDMGAGDLAAGSILVFNGALTVPGTLTADSLTLQFSGALLKPGSAYVAVNSLTLDGANLDMGAGALTAASVSVSNGTLTTAAATSVSTLSLDNGSVAGGGVQAVSQYNFQNIPAGSPASKTVWGGAATQMNVGGDGNLVVLAGSNTYGGATVLLSGALQAVDGVGLPSASNLQLDGGVLETSGTFARRLGPGSGRVQWTQDGDGGGFSAYGGNLTVALAGAPSPLIWGGTPFFVGSGVPLMFNSPTATGQVIFTHNINLGGADQKVYVDDNPALATDYAILAGALGSGGLIKQGNGTLVLANTNSYARDTDIQGGAIQARDGVGLPAASKLHLDGGVLETSGTFTRALGPGLTWDSGGFSAYGGNLLVTLGNTGAYTPRQSGVDGFPMDMVFGSATANGQVELPHAIDLNLPDDWRNITVNQAPGAAASALLSGAITNGRIDKWGQGELKLTNPSTSLYGLRVHDGTVTLTDATIDNSVNGLNWDHVMVGSWGDHGIQATLNVNGNTHISLQGNSALYLGAGNDSSNVTVLNVNGGTISQDGSGEFAVSEAGLFVAYAGGRGTVNQNGGLINMPRNGVILGCTTNNDGPAVGIYNLDGGTLSAFDVRGGSGDSYFNFNGGLLRATADNANFMPGNSGGTTAFLTAATVQAGGAKIDTGGHNVAIAQSLLHDATLTGPDGGLTKLGDGTLVLSGSNTYTGGTVVAAGTLIVANSYSLLDGTSLTVGDPASFSHASIVPQESPALSAVSPVPEPGALVLLFSALAMPFLGGFLKSIGCSPRQRD